MLAAHAYTYLISILLGLFLSVVILPLTGKNKSRKTKLCMLPVLILLFIGIVLLGAYIGYLTEHTDEILAYSTLVLFGFGLLSLIVSLFRKKKRTKGLILVTVFIMLLSLLAICSLFAYTGLLLYFLKDLHQNC